MSAIAAAIIAAIPALFQAGMGISQTVKGNKLSKEQTPDYEISPTLMQMIKAQRQRAQGEMTGTQEMIGEQRQTSSNVLENMAKYGVIDPNAVSQVQDTERGVVGNIGLKGTEWQSNEQDKYMGVLGMLSGEEKNKWDWETRQDFERRMMAASAMQGSGLQNIYGTTTSVADMAGTRQMSKWMGYEFDDDKLGDWGKSLLSKLFNKNNTTNNNNNNSMGAGVNTYNIF